MDDYFCENFLLVCEVPHEQKLLIYKFMKKFNYLDVLKIFTYQETISWKGVSPDLF